MTAGWGRSAEGTHCKGGQGRRLLPPPASGSRFPTATVSSSILMTGPLDSNSLMLFLPLILLCLVTTSGHLSKSSLNPFLFLLPPYNSCPWNTLITFIFLSGDKDDPVGYIRQTVFLSTFHILGNWGIMVKWLVWSQAAIISSRAGLLPWASAAPSMALPAFPYSTFHCVFMTHNGSSLCYWLPCLPRRYFIPKYTYFNAIKNQPSNFPFYKNWVFWMLF